MEYKMGTAPAEWKPAPRVCRCCLSEGCYKDISTEYYWLGEKEMYSQMLKECFDLTISLSEAAGNSRLICEVCITRLRDASNFKKQVINSEKRFAEHLRSGASLSVAEVQETPVLVDIKVEGVKDEAAISDDDPDPVDDDIGDPDYDESDDLPLKFEVQKKESMTELSFGDEIPALNTSETTIRKVSSRTKEKSALKKLKMNKKELTIKPVKASTSKKKDKEAKVKLKATKPGAKKGPLKMADLTSKMIKINPTPSKSSVQTVHKKTEILDSLNDPKRFDNMWRRESMKVGSKCRLVEDAAVKPDDTDWRSRNLVTIVEFSKVYPFLTSVGKYKCYVCMKEFVDPAVLKYHTLNDHSVKEIIGPIFSRKSEQYVKVDVSAIECKLCSENIVDLQALKLHLKDTHKKLIQPQYKDNIVPFFLGGNSYDCQLCSSKFLDMKPLIQHMNKHFVNYSCEVCGASFLTIRSLRIHSTSHESGSHKCGQCDKVFSSIAKRAAHVRIVHEKKEIVRSCPKCSVKFRTQYSRVVHMVQQHGAPHPNFKCDSCDRTFFLSTSLKLHFRRVHLNERTQECTVCGLRFINNSDVRKHMASHSEHKCHRCHYCGKAYTRKDNLAFHMKRHRAEPPVQVEGSTYNWSGAAPQSQP